MWINKKIKGISINNKEYHISQYADDTDFILDGSSISLEETIDTLNIFAELSGLNINYDKSVLDLPQSCTKKCHAYVYHIPPIFQVCLLLLISRSSQCSTTGVTKAMLCAILSVGWCI